MYPYFGLTPDIVNIKQCCTGEVGNASKMNLVLQLIGGVTLAGIAEGMALADRAGLQQKDVMEVMELTSLACPFMLDKGKGTKILHLVLNIQSNSSQDSRLKVPKKGVFNVFQ